MDASPTPQPNRRLAGPGPLILTVEDSSETVVLRMAGDFDLGGVGQVMTAVDGVDMESTNLLVLDLEKVTFLDISALRTILRTDDHCKHHAIHMTVITPRGLASRVFTLTRAHRDLDLVDAERRPRGTRGVTGLAGFRRRRLG